jgi:AcrR family transcriptional regulator
MSQDARDGVNERDSESESVSDMGINIDHDARRREILDEALRLFTEQGYPAVTYQKIADRCGIARTSIYRYFSCKKEIFDFAIRQLTVRMGRRFLEVLADPGSSPSQKIHRIVTDALDAIADQRLLLRVVVDYLLNQHRAGDDMSAKLQRHTLVIRRMLQRLFAQGMQAQEFVSLPPRRAADVVYGLLEAAVFQVTVTDTDNPVHMHAAFDTVLDGLKAH